MKFYWAEMQISNADNFEEMYTDANIKTFSRANAVDKNIKLMETYRAYAQELETNYGRVTAQKTASIGDINE
jgi:ASC-1-like (ASCH) protein